MPVVFGDIWQLQPRKVAKRFYVLICPCIALVDEGGEFAELNQAHGALQVRHSIVEPEFGKTRQ